MSLPLIICMGVSGSGKSTLASEIADTFHLQFIEADDLHSEKNVKKMQSGFPLSDSDRAPWMKKVCSEIKTYASTGCVLAHSGLRRAHRAQLRSCGMPTLFFHLHAPKNVIAKRMKNRSNHFMPPSLLDSQFKALEDTNGEPDVITLDAELNSKALLHRISETIDRFKEI